jgi:hypothetical protein
MTSIVKIIFASIAGTIIFDLARIWPILRDLTWKSPGWTLDVVPRAIGLSLLCGILRLGKGPGKILLATFLGAAMSYDVISLSFTSVYFWENALLLLPIVSVASLIFSNSPAPLKWPKWGLILATTSLSAACFSIFSAISDALQAPLMGLVTSGGYFLPGHLFRSWLTGLAVFLSYTWIQDSFSDRRKILSLSAVLFLLSIPNDFFSWLLGGLFESPLARISYILIQSLLCLTVTVLSRCGLSSSFSFLVVSAV